MRLLFIFLILLTTNFFAQEKDNFDLEVKQIINSNKDIEYLEIIYEYYKKNEWDSLLIYSDKLLKTTKNEKLNNLAHYFRGHSFRKKKIFNESLKEYNLISSKFSFYSYVQCSIGEIYLNQIEYKKALKIFIPLIKKYNMLSFKPKESVLLHNIGLCYFHLKEFENAESYLLKSTELLKQEKNTSLLIACYMDIANLYYEQYKDNQAIPYFQKAYALSKKIKNFEIKQNAALNMAVVEENRKDLTKAMLYRKEYDTWKDSVNNQNKIWAVAETEKKYAISQKQKEIQLLESENKVKVSQRNGFVASSILFLLLFGTAFYFYNQKSKTNKIIEAQKEDLDALNATKDKLFSIVSHDLRSSVNMLKGTNTKLLKDIANRDYDALDKIVHKNAAITNSTFNLLENLLHWATLQTQQLYFHIESVHLYSVIQQIEYNYKPLFENKNLVFTNTIPKATQVLADLNSLKIILRNLLDNAIKFSNENGIISVYIDDKNDAFHYLIIEDTGIGMDEETRTNLLKEGNLLNKKKNQKGIGTGLGLQLCKSMIQKNNGIFTIESTENSGTKMIIGLPKYKSNG
ncbi:MULTISPECIES: tetratricopeptide repeat-containing sensor histidine kinase [unclassified Flavobacterium]|uniref:tetratricopeptide repeat-containing sensor histidine kinase n=1 Tax=unclassified Flavobacterium TaxID=196869 RepID=UPI00131DD360|nr:MULTISPECIES: tetratricopeptide repeat-containing sensor histidine kinase [unclassified Flavobacterium]